MAKYPGWRVLVVTLGFDRDIGCDMRDTGLAVGGGEDQAGGGEWTISDDKGLPAETLRPGKVEVGEVGWRVDSRKFDIGADVDDVKAGRDVGTGTGVDGVRMTEVGNAGVFRGTTFLPRAANSVTFPSTRFAIGTSGPGDICSSATVAADLIFRVRFGLFAGRRSGSCSYRTKFDSISNIIKPI